MSIAANPQEYLVARVAQALATDDRTNALDVQVEHRAGAVVIRGTVACGARREAAERVVGELLPHPTRLINLLCVQTFQEPTEAERIDRLP
jgi:hypothetical protein